MAATLSVVVWPINHNLYYLANIRDSRIYSVYQSQVEVLTKNDAILFQEKVLTHGGLRIIHKPVLNKVMGMNPLNVSVIEKPLREGEIIILATDGFFDSRKSIFFSTIAGLSQAENFQESFQTIMIKKNIKHV